MPVNAAASLEESFFSRLGQLLPEGFSGKLGIAVSGGSDSTALLLLAQRYSAKRGIQIRAVTVDHGLRPEAASEAVEVARLCSDIGVPHDILRWEDWDQRGNLQSMAREARYRLISDWAKPKGLGVVALGHTLDDQAETVLLRLARGSGVDGLSGMRGLRHSKGIDWVRPLLGNGRKELRAWLQQHGVSWVDDPGNENARFDRVKARKALALLADLGITSEGIAETASRLQSAREALEMATVSAVRSCASAHAGAVRLDVPGLLAVPYEIRRRILAHAVCWVSAAEYAPRHASLDAVLKAIADGQSAALHGCLIRTTQDQCLIVRELKAAAASIARVGEIWDGRWRVSGPEEKGQFVGVLGESGLISCTGWRESGLPRAVLSSSPAVWAGDKLVSAPLAGLERGYRAELVRPDNEFESSILSH